MKYGAMYKFISHLRDWDAPTWIFLTGGDLKC